MVGDLGLGKAMDMSSRLTMVGGTPTYVAPEQALGEGLDPRADQFSLAALSYYLLAGRQPYDHESLSAAEDPVPPAADGDRQPRRPRPSSSRRCRRTATTATTTSSRSPPRSSDAMGGQVDEAPQAWIRPTPT